MIFAQMVMVVPMSITSVHMKAHHHSLNALSLVISAHTLGMFAFSMVSGRMTDRWGRTQVIILGSVVLILSCLMAAPSTGLTALIVALFLLDWAGKGDVVVIPFPFSDLSQTSRQYKTHPPIHRRRSYI